MNKTLIHPYEGKFSSILLFGPPGAGKGTLGKFLSGAGSQFHLCSGDIFRTLPAHSPAGKLYHSFASKGQTLPDDATIEIWKYYVQGLIAINSYYPEGQDLLLEGIPRTRDQAQMLSSFISVRHIIVLDIADKEELMQRIQNQARLSGRKDEAAFLEKKLESYEENIKSILDYYPKHLISYVNGSQKPLEVLRDVLVRLSHLLSRPSF